MAPALPHPATISYHPDSPESRQRLHARLHRFNSLRLSPAYSPAETDWPEALKLEQDVRILEVCFVENERQLIARLAQGAPAGPTAFMEWFEKLRDTGPGQGDALFPWLAHDATLEEMRWFLTQEAAGEAGFEDLVALTQVRFPTRAKLEMARNYWDEMGRGHERGMHGLMLHAVVRELDLRPSVDNTVWEALALSNLMAALAGNRFYAYQSIGALGVIEMTAPGRVSQVNAGLKRLSAREPTRAYFQLHAGLDIKHSKAWNEEIIAPLIKDNPETARPIAEGALMRLAGGARCFERYRAHFGL